MLWSKILQNRKNTDFDPKNVFQGAHGWYHFNTFKMMIESSFSCGTHEDESSSAFHKCPLVFSLDQRFPSQSSCPSWWSGLNRSEQCVFTVKSSQRCSANGHLSPSVFQGERIEKGQGTWDPSEEPPRDVITLLTPLLFSVCTRDILQRNGKKETTVQALQLLRFLQCYWFDYYYMYNSIFSHIYSFHWLDFGRRVATPPGL